MFCHKCGTKASEGAAFCPKCGAKLIVEHTTQQVTAPTPAGQVQPQANNPQADIPQKKKSKKQPIIFGAVALVVVVIIVIAMNWNGKTDYEATVRAHQPFVSQGTDLTYGEVLDKYISSPDWNVRKSDDANYVDITGKAKGTDNNLAVTIKVTDDPYDPDLVKISPESLTIDGKKSPTKDEAVEFLLAMFFAYDEGYNDLSELLSGIALTGLTEGQREVNLTETYTNEAEGISFQYPAGWVILDFNSDFTVVDMIDSANTEDHIAKFHVGMCLDNDPYGVYTQDEAAVRKNVSEYHTFLDLGDTLLGDIPAKVLKYQTEGLKGDDIVVCFWYVIGENTYQIIFSYAASTVDTYEPVFNAIMNSFTIAASTSGESQTSDNNDSVGVTTDNMAETMNQVLYCGIPVQEIIGMTEEEVIAKFGEPGIYTEDTMDYGYDTSQWMSFDVSYGDTVCGFSATPENFTFNGQSLKQDYDTMVTILGDSRIEKGGTTYVFETAWAYGGCEITFRFPTYRNETEDDKVVDVRVYPIG